jgi:very-short-patch-repair endonuclease
VAQGLIRELLPGVFASSTQAESFRTRAEALRLWLPKTCVVSGLAALTLLDLAATAPSRVTVVAPNNRHLRVPDWVRLVRTGLVRTRELPDGVMCAARERAVIDAWVECPDRDRVSVVLEAMRRSNLKGSAVLRELGKMPRVRGRRELVRILNEASEGIQSYLEHRAHRTVLNTADFRGLQRQVTFTAMGKTYTVDTYDAESRTVIEFDGAKVHGTRERKAYDNARDAALLTLGIATIRIGYDDVMTRPLWCREVIRRAIAARATGSSRVARVL